MFIITYGCDTNDFISKHLIKYVKYNLLILYYFFIQYTGHKLLSTYIFLFFLSFFIFFV